MLGIFLKKPLSIFSLEAGKQNRRLLKEKKLGYFFCPQSNIDIDLLLIIMIYY